MKRLFLLSSIIIASVLSSSCSAEDPMEDTTIVTVYYNPDEDVLHVDNTRYESKGLEYAYEIPNDGTDEYYVALIRNRDGFTMHFNAAYEFDKLLLTQYDFKMTQESIPWEVNANDSSHYILKGPNEKLKKPSTGYYKFIVIGYHAR